MVLVYFNFLEGIGFYYFYLIIVSRHKWVKIINSLKITTNLPNDTLLYIYIYIYIFPLILWYIQNKFLQYKIVSCTCMLYFLKLANYPISVTIKMFYTFSHVTDFNAHLKHIVTFVNVFFHLYKHRICEIFVKPIF